MPDRQRLSQQQHRKGHAEDRHPVGVQRGARHAQRDQCAVPDQGAQRAGQQARQHQQQHGAGREHRPRRQQQAAVQRQVQQQQGGAHGKHDRADHCRIDLPGQVLHQHPAAHPGQHRAQHQQVAQAATAQGRTGAGQHHGGHTAKAQHHAGQPGGGEPVSQQRRAHQGGDQGVERDDERGIGGCGALHAPGEGELVQVDHQHAADQQQAGLARRGARPGQVAQPQHHPQRQRGHHHAQHRHPHRVQPLDQQLDHRQVAAPHRHGQQQHRAHRRAGRAGQARWRRRAHASARQAAAKRAAWAATSATAMPGRYSAEPMPKPDAPAA